MFLPLCQKSINMKERKEEGKKGGRKEGREERKKSRHSNGIDQLWCLHFRLSGARNSSFLPNILTLPEPSCHDYTICERI